MTATTDNTMLAGERRSPGVNVWKGLLWREWLQHRSLIVGSFVAWFLFAWVLLIFYHPGFILGVGFAVGCLLGWVLAGSDPSEGSEEFAFSLPPTRSQRYLVRLALGGGTVLALTLLGTLSIALDLPQLVWSIFVQTGFTEPFPRVEHLCLYWLAVAIPFAAFAFTFFSAALARTRGGASGSVLLGILCTGMIFLAGHLIETNVWPDSVNGYVSVPSLFVLGAAALALGYFLYLRKEGISRPAPLQAGGGWWILIIAVIVVLILFSWLSYVRVGKARSYEAERQRDIYESKQVPERSVNPPAEAAPEGGR